MEPTLEVRFDDDPPEWTGPRSEFLEANTDDGEVSAVARELEVGAVAVFGGGAAPTVRVRRVS